ncbi:regulatory signaling modulator protein AmpE [Gilvimarinus sp. SDUM040013]|uniref:Regulatory signaling modulator protein AmpE n=1 Tax=Gilvimarinus gilvus TaxID=3058038 RepID=A0ABU4RSP9_9GAMM|nr:regulatory signaling modulator protein AmpE [Gilvimarinus sp. SDUM040013]MDO3388370.1 regulatory signaling modulator protein AmpE [Gilvimarinus sp. SDUM040013]MDX6847920.1 regulatory signaling modulator protein AmpE [Gilvimarinus sp. SDUM040013]
MAFLSLIIVLLLVQWWGSGKPLQQDGWFFSLWARIDAQQEKLPFGHITPLLGALLLPIGFVFLLQVWLQYNGLWIWLLPINVVVLLFSLGRGDFSGFLHHYLEAAKSDNSVRAAQVLDEYNLDPQLRKERVGDSWMELHAEALRVFGYRGFERMFAVIFWFMILGVAGALAYRLLILAWSRWLEVNDSRAACLERVLVWVEWPAARLMGVAWALVGNFEVCMKPWRQSCLKLVSAQTFLSGIVRGALGDDQSCDGNMSTTTAATRIEPAYSLSLVKNLEGMFSRALLFWVVVVAIVSVLI